MSNLALKGNATASSFIKPYEPSRAIDGSIQPIQRWLSNAPCYLTVDLRAPQWIDRWIVTHMGAVGWRPEYSNSSFKLQGSKDSVKWFDIDVVDDNTLSHLDRKFSAVQCRWVRVFVRKGLRVNRKLASIVEFGVYQAAPTSPYLTNITLSSGTLQPSFALSKYSYSADVGYGQDSITLTPTAQDPDADITVNGQTVKSGEASQPIGLDVGENTIAVEVTSKVGGVKETYTVEVNRASNSYLESFGTMPRISMNPAFDPKVYSYTASTGASRLIIRAKAQDDNAQITVNGNPPTQAVSLQNGKNTITIEVTPATGNKGTQYTLEIDKQ